MKCLLNNRQCFAADDFHLLALSSAFLVGLRESLQPVPAGQQRCIRVGADFEEKSTARQPARGGGEELEWFGQARTSHSFRTNRERAFAHRCPVRIPQNCVPPSICFRAENVPGRLTWIPWVCQLKSVRIHAAPRTHPCWLNRSAQRVTPHRGFSHRLGRVDDGKGVGRRSFVFPRSKNASRSKC